MARRVAVSRRRDTTRRAGRPRLARPRAVAVCARGAGPTRRGARLSVPPCALPWRRRALRRVNLRVRSAYPRASPATAPARRCRAGVRRGATSAARRANRTNSPYTQKAGCPAGIGVALGVVAIFGVGLGETTKWLNAMRGAAETRGTPPATVRAAKATASGSARASSARAGDGARGTCGRRSLAWLALLFGASLCRTHHGPLEGTGVSRSLRRGHRTRRGRGPQGSWRVA